MVKIEYHHYDSEISEIPLDQSSQQDEEFFLGSNNPVPPPILNTGNSGSNPKPKSRAMAIQQYHEGKHDLCKVCGDVSTGLHYGVETCEGCKVIFKILTLGFLSKIRKRRI